jgi:hypothetical protein
VEEYMQISVYMSIYRHISVAITDNEYINFQLDSKLIVDLDYYLL